MPKRSRLTGAELRRVTGARRIHGALFSVALSPAPGRAKATITVSKKVSPKAVVRNTLKRRARAILSPLVKQFPAGAYVFSVRPQARDATFADLKADLYALARKIS
ncbi:MAG TPA: ribonuclease P protein component [Candidatus Paceibacterota bacterium]|nr:ribonuclease P protein component [Candidatus Paceibacterota bacterium]